VDIKITTLIKGGKNKMGGPYQTLLTNRWAAKCESADEEWAKTGRSSVNNKQTALPSDGKRAVARAISTWNY